MFNIQTTNEYQTTVELKAMNAYSQKALNGFKSNANQAYNTFWFGQAPPQEKIKALGTQALKIFTTSAQAQAFIASQDTSYAPLAIPEGYTIEWNNDGSGVITYSEPTSDTDDDVGEDAIDQ